VHSVPSVCSFVLTSTTVLLADTAILHTHQRLQQDGFHCLVLSHLSIEIVPTDVHNHDDFVNLLDSFLSVCLSFSMYACTTHI
jgi:hypothetical protein